MLKPAAAAALIATCALAGCTVHADTDSSPKVSRTYQVGNFQKIEVAGPYDVEVRTGGNPGVSANGSEKLLARTIVEVQGDKLMIRPERSNHWFGGWTVHRGGAASFVVTVPQLSGATIAGSGDIKVNKVQGNQFDGTVAGSGGIDVAAMNVQQLKLTIAGSGGVKARGGTAQSAQYDIAGSGDLDAAGVQAQTAKATIAGSGSIRAQAKAAADVSIMGSGDVEVTGGAKCSISKAGSGSVRCS